MLIKNALDNGEFVTAVYTDWYSNIGNNSSPSKPQASPSVEQSY
jgi:hypothetical protein